MIPAEILKQMADRDCPFVFRIVDRDPRNPGVGTAVLVSDPGGTHGYALTCWHNIDWYDEHHCDWRGEMVPLPATIAVLARWHNDVMEGGHPVELMGRWSNPSQDIAVLQLPRKVIKEFRLRPAPISFHVRLGAPVIVRGFDRPWQNASLATYRGRIPDSIDPFTVLDGDQKVFVVRLDVAWQRGMSGGAVFDTDQGALIGVACRVHCNRDEDAAPRPRSQVEIGYATAMQEAGNSWTPIRKHCQVVEPPPPPPPPLKWAVLVRVQKWAVLVWVMLALVSLTVFGYRLRACFLPVSAELRITTHPRLDGRGSEAPELIAGTVTGVNSADHRIVVFAHTNAWWVQPWTDNYLTDIESDGKWTAQTRLGDNYAALLVRSAFALTGSANPAPSLPTGPDVLAKTCVVTKNGACR